MERLYSNIWYTVRANLGTVRCCFGSEGNGRLGRFGDVRPGIFMGAVWFAISVENHLTSPIPGRAVIERYIQRVLS